MKRNFNLKKSEIEDICHQYSNGTTTKEICKKYGFTSPVLYRVLKTREIKLHGPAKIKQGKIDELVKILNDGQTLKEACLIIKISKSAAKKYLKEINYKIKPGGRFQRLYELDEKFLQKIDSKEKAQFLGILFSDGTISSRNNLISLRLEVTDVEYLLKIKEIIKSNKPIYVSKGRAFISPLNKKEYMGNDTAILDITSKNFYNDALKAGLLPRKTWLNLGIPDSIPKKFKKDFILGVFEGDGCLTWNEKYEIVCLSFAGSENITKDICELVKKELNILGTIKPHFSIFVLEYKRYNDVIKILNWLYKTPAFFMARKRDKYLKFLEYMKNKGYDIFK